MVVEVVVGGTVLYGEIKQEENGKREKRRGGKREEKEGAVLMMVLFC